METRDDNLERIFHLVLEAPELERATVLARECGRDEVLRRKIETMIAAAQDDRFLNAPTVRQPDIALDSLASSAERPGSSIGPYKLLQQIGEGGFGSVYMAQQERPVTRKVALKIIKLGMDTRQVVARFEQERQALAMMDHPNVARVFDAGATETGRPYFVMELCAGEAITTYCDKNNLSIAQRLDLFVQVCMAVQHAHQKGLIHRDIKPSNVLVSTQDGRPHAKIIDFGIAKATAAKLTEMTLFTEHKQLIGTPQYMSPEQAEGSLDIDTRTDVYSLGVLLYELLTGSTPFDPKSLRAAAYGEIQRIIREVEPPKPSTRLQQSSETIASVASRRDVEPKKLGTIVRGELDWIVMKALEKDRGRRYDSANALGADIQRYRAGEAVVAAPVSRSYLLRKLARRNKGAVIATSAVMAALAIGALAFAWQAIVARKERDRAITAEAQTAERAAELQKVSDFQSQMLAQVDATGAGLRLTSDVRAKLDAALTKAGVPEQERAAQLAAFTSAWARLNSTDLALELIKSTILAPAMETIDRQFGDQPKLNAKLRRAISERYLDLGLMEESRAAFEQVLETRRTTLGDDDPDTIDALLGKCKLLTLLGKPAESEAILRPLIGKMKGTAGADQSLYFRATEYLGEALVQRNQNAQAEVLFRESLAGRRRVLGDDHQDTLMSIGNLAMALRGEAKLAEAEALNREVLDRRRRKYGEQSVYALSSYNNLGVILLDEGRFPEAAASFQKSAEGRRKALGEAHRDTIITTSNLASAYGRMEKYAEEESIERDLLARTRRILGPDHPDALMILSNLASTLITEGKLDEAEPLCRESLERRMRVFGANSAGAATANNVMAYLLRRQKRDEDAEPYIHAALAASTAAWGMDHGERFVQLLNLGQFTRDHKRYAESEPLYREVMERSKRTLGAEHEYTLMAVQGLGETYFNQKKYADVVPLYAEAEPAFRSAAAKYDGGQLRVLLLGLGLSRVKTQDFANAETNLKEAYARYSAARGPTAKGTQQCVQGLIDLYNAWHAAEPARGHDQAVAEWRARLTAPASTHPTSTPSSQPAALDHPA